MKNLLRNMATGLLSLMLLATAVQAQEIPQKVKEAFTQKFPNGQNVEWGKETETEYEADFSLDGKEMSANFDSVGQWKETEVNISSDELPDAIKQTLSRDFSDRKVDHAYKVSTSEETLYEVVVANGDEEEYDEEGEEEEHETMEQDEEDEEHEAEEAEEEYEHEKHLQELVFTADGKLVKKQETEVDED